MRSEGKAVGGEVGVPGYERHRGDWKHFQTGQPPTLSALEMRLRTTCCSLPLSPITKSAYWVGERWEEGLMRKGEVCRIWVRYHIPAFITRSLKGCEEGFKYVPYGRLRQPHLGHPRGRVEG